MSQLAHLNPFHIPIHRHPDHPSPGFLPQLRSLLLCNVLKNSTWTSRVDEWCPTNTAHSLGRSQLLPVVWIDGSDLQPEGPHKPFEMIRTPPVVGRFGLMLWWPISQLTTLSSPCSGCFSSSPLSSCTVITCRKKELT